MRHCSVRLPLIACLLALFAACHPAPPGGQPIVVLVGIDGFRGDYLERFEPPTLRALAAEGVRSEGLIPQFPSKTFPNHYTIVTGLRLAHHGILSNNMVAPDIPGRFSLSNRGVLADPRWWSGEPIWNTAERQGLVTSSMFWPGSEAKIGGRQATYWMPYEHAMPNDERVAKTLDWITRPAGEGASFATLYFSDVDSAGHTGGPDAPAVREAVARVDASLAKLVDGVREAGLGDRVHYVVASDHGMSQLSTDRAIVLDDFVDLETVDVIDWSPVLALAPKDGDVDAVYTALKDRHPSLAVYRSHELPERFGLAGHRRLPPVIGIADDGWLITSRRDMARWTTTGNRGPGGAHGYDPQVRSMHGLFLAAGPGIQQGLLVPPLENIHLYEFMCALLRIQPAKNDGDLSVTRPLLR